MIVASQAPSLSVVNRLKKRVFGENIRSKDDAKWQTESPEMASKNQGFLPTQQNEKIVKTESEEKLCDDSEDGKQHIIPLQELVFSEELGRGEFGNIVRRAEWNRKSMVDGKKNSPFLVAVKSISFEITGFISTKDLLHEVIIMTRLHHENVIRLHGIVLDSNAIMLVSEIAVFGSLLSCLRKEKSRSEFSIVKLCHFATQIATGMEYLKEQHVVHRDLAARNVLVCSRNRVKISDFGLSRLLRQEKDYYRSNFDSSIRLPIAWCAPECLLYARFTNASDVWAFATTLWEMFSYGRQPWEGLTSPEILHKIDNDRQLLDCPLTCPAEHYRLMSECWTHNPVERPTFEELRLRLANMIPLQLLVVRDASPQYVDILPYKKGQIITLLEKRLIEEDQNQNGNESVNDSLFWIGVLEDGQFGRFSSEDVVACLSAENPCQRSSSIEHLNTQMAKKTKQVREKADKKQRPQISQPLDLRHICHVGEDGQSFGLLNIAKNDLVKALPPIVQQQPKDADSSKSSPRMDQNSSMGTLSINITSNNSPISSGIPSPSPLPPIASENTISLAPPRPPKTGSKAPKSSFFKSHSFLLKNTPKSTCVPEQNSSKTSKAAFSGVGGIYDGTAELYRCFSTKVPSAQMLKQKTKQNIDESHETNSNEILGRSVKQASANTFRLPTRAPPKKPPRRLLPTLTEASSEDLSNCNGVNDKYETKNGRNNEGFDQTEKVMPEDELRRPMSLHAEVSPLPNFKPIENVEKSKKDVRASSITCLDELDQVLIDLKLVDKNTKDGHNINSTYHSSDRSDKTNDIQNDHPFISRNTDKQPLLLPYEFTSESKRNAPLSAAATELLVTGSATLRRAASSISDCCSPSDTTNSDDTNRILPMPVEEFAKIESEARRKLNKQLQQLEAETREMQKSAASDGRLIRSYSERAKSSRRIHGPNSQPLGLSPEAMHAYKSLVDYGKQLHLMGEQRAELKSGKEVSTNVNILATKGTPIDYINPNLVGFDNERITSESFGKCSLNNPNAMFNGPNRSYDHGYLNTLACDDYTNKTSYINMDNEQTLVLPPPIPKRHQMENRAPPTVPPKPPKSKHLSTLGD